jgi:hypothetical protein
MLDEVVLFTSKLALKHVRKKPVKCYTWRIVFYVLELGHLGKQIGNTLKVLKFGAGEGWRSVAPNV